MNAGFIGLGTMGGPMAKNILKKGHSLVVYDVVQQSVDKGANDIGPGLAQTSRRAHAAQALTGRRLLQEGHRQHFAHVAKLLLHRDQSVVAMTSASSAVAADQPLGGALWLTARPAGLRCAKRAYAEVRGGALSTKLGRAESLSESLFRFG